MIFRSDWQKIVKQWAIWKIIDKNNCLLVNWLSAIVYCSAKKKKVHFASVKFDAQAKRGHQSYETNKCFFSIAHDFFFYWGGRGGSEIWIF